MENIVNRVVEVYKSTRELSERQQSIVEQGVSNIVASLIETQAEKLSRYEKN